MARLGSMGCRPLSWDPIGFLSSPHLDPTRGAATIRPPGAPPLRLCGDVSAGSSAKPARERGLSLDPYRSRTPVRCFVAPCLMPFDANFRPLIPSLSFPPQLTKVLPAQVARSARRRSTSRLHERARHVWRRGIVKRLFVTVSSRRSFSVSELHLKDFDRCDALT